ncbi:MAG: hypothetical protein DMF73_05735 [Acidobacteria bacterium]|nr:MAG: hypothetical protein DMF73_05735 [Acidobacteriota bacterium]
MDYLNKSTADLSRYTRIRTKQNCFRVHLRKSAFIRGRVVFIDALPDGRASDTESNDKSKTIRYYAAPTLLKDSPRQLK